MLIFRGQEYHLSKTSSGSSSILFVSVSPFTFGKYIYIHYCTIIAIRDVDDINGRKVCDWWLLIASTVRIIMIAMRDVDDINGRKVRDWWHSSRLLSALYHLMASTSRIIMIAMRDVDEIKGRKACDWRHPSIGYYKRVNTSCDGIHIEFITSNARCGWNQMTKSVRNRWFISIRYTVNIFCMWKKAEMTAFKYV